jgi:FMN phosphatase YigB (HAD superfamily)
MSNDSASIIPASQPTTLGDRLRNIAETLRQETDTQIKATSRILGAAAQMAQNHDQLIGEVVEMVEEDLHQRKQSQTPATYEVPDLQKEFKTLKAAKSRFGIKANSWDSLATKLNEANGVSISNETPIPPSNPSQVLERLDRIELEIRALQGSMEQVLGLLQEMTKLS